mmetsp:Transcript_4841/g.13986  ORF Transcript_4841/g.13986 Transcript_4841/m.13986 type:complete len:168 (-) Transcript_4841:336-839(-)
MTSTRTNQRSHQSPITNLFFSIYPLSTLSHAFRPPDVQARLLSQRYRALTEKEMKKWTKKAEADKIRYQEEMKHYVPTEEPGGGKRKKAKKDPNAPKRNMSAYFLYSVHIRPEIKQNNPEASFGDIARIISAQFKELSEKERKRWDKKAAEDKERYQREMAEYERTG